jgi:hypothetical protein
MDYVHINPLKDCHVTRVADWPYSTFHLYVTSGVYSQDWCESVDGALGGWSKLLKGLFRCKRPITLSLIEPMVLEYHLVKLFY